MKIGSLVVSASFWFLFSASPSIGKGIQPRVNIPLNISKATTEALLKYGSIKDHGTSETYAHGIEYKRGYDHEHVYDQHTRRVEGEIEGHTFRNILYGFVERLKAFVSETDFDYRDFESHIEHFREVISDLDFLAETEINYEGSASQLAFARHMFQFMVDSTERLKRYNRSDIPGADLLYNMIDLNVQVLTLQNSYGDLDIRTDMQTEKLHLLYRNLYAWREEFRKIPKVPRGMQALFVSQGSLAKSTIERLLAQISFR
ncbi:hypothetical protein JCM33374_g6429 [Metschnikowia sp. JCM 33374]|nr:hypothetical protein JCM33374_g6429 [Metschnikowia sp. JCM 33374]